MEPPMFASGCGFYGSVENKNLCSKSYKDHLNQENMNAAASADVTSKEKLNLGSFVSGISSSPSFQTSSVTSLVSDDHKYGNNDIESSVGVTDKNRCQSCNEKVGVLEFQCRCGGVFCGMHRPRRTFMHFGSQAGWERCFSQENPLCKGDKLEWSFRDDEVVLEIYYCLFACYSLALLRFNTTCFC
ncbi:hypothetical protein C1H46_011018 [Malus baccata]|uniref:A20-type domain-containing protein n=1 Tax=Malus baccata TaxID=106549 RepID=A0A540MX69_MALBA|nr:hypothetical protein C1H46_011018 [Malus baccata]